MTGRSAPSGGTGAATPCRLCGGPSLAAFVVGDRNRGLGRGRFAYRRCQACGSLFLPEVPSDLASYYAADGYGSVGDPEVPHVVRGEQEKLDLLMPFAPAKTMIEIGPGPGTFTRVAQRAGFQITAIEMDGEYCRQLRELLGVQAIHSSDPAQALQALPASATIVMWHVIEHLPDPWRVLDSCVQRLQPGGVLAISTPNPGSLQFHLLGRYWAHLDAPRHLQLLPAATLRSRLERAGMRHLRTTTTDQVGRDCNRLGWEYAIRRHPARHPSTMLTSYAGRLLTEAFSSVERRRLAGSTYSSVFMRPAAGS